MSVSVQFAADMETSTGCNEEEGFTLLQFLNVSEWHSAKSISSLF